jgi:ankyrin repeat protein
MKSQKPRKRLPVNPSLEHLQKQAKRIAKQNPSLKLAETQHQIARDYGCKNWTELTRVVEVMRRGADQLVNVLTKVEPLPKAARSGDIEDIRRILQGGQFTQLDLDQGLAHALWYDGHGWASRKAIADLLLEHGADPDGQYGSNYGPIVFGTGEAQEPEGLQYLIDAGADVTFPPIQTKYGVQCPMSQVLGAYIRGNNDRKHRCIDILLKHGACIPPDVSPPILAIHRGDAAQLGEMLQRDRDLLKRRFPDMPYGNMRLRGATLLHCAVEFGEIECVEELFKCWADINMQADVIDGIGGQTAFFHAINTFGDKNFGMLEYLVKRVGQWIDMSVRATWQLFDKIQPEPMTPLEYAEYAINLDTRKWRSKVEEELAILRNLDKATQLKQAILRTEMPAINGLLNEHPELLTPALWPPAIYESKSLAVTKLLLERGLDPNRCSAPRLPLHLAVYQVLPDIVESLLEAGADPNFLNSLGERPLELLDAYEPRPVGDSDTKRIRELLVQAGARMDFISSVRMGDIQNLKEMLAGGLAIPPSALHAAARSGRAEVVKLLLLHGANPDEINEKKNTPLWFSAQSPSKPASNRVEVMKQLLDAGADINRRCENGSTALHFAAWRGPVEVVEFLLSRSARNWIADAEGKLPIDYANRSNVSPDKESIVKLFSEPRIESPLFREAVGAITAGDLNTLQRLLKEYPDLVHARAEEKGEFAGSYFSHPYLLEFVPENPIRTRKLPPNICEITQAIIDAGSPLEAINKTLRLAASGDVPRECGVQTELLELLVRNGADATEGLNAAIGEGQWNAAETLLRLGAQFGLKAAAGLGRVERLTEMLSSLPSVEELALAADAAIRGGHTDCVKLLLDAGLPASTCIPNHPYSATLLHQAAWFGHRAIVELFHKRGADLTETDTQFKGTPADWARHAGHMEISEWLLSKQ